MHNNSIRQYEQLLMEAGVHLDTLGHRPLIAKTMDEGAAAGDTGLTANMTQVTDGPVDSNSGRPSLMAPGVTAATSTIAF